MFWPDHVVSMGRTFGIDDDRVGLAALDRHLPPSWQLPPHVIRHFRHQHHFRAADNAAITAR